MSKFVIPIFVNVEGVKKLLPPNAYINGVSFNEKKSQVELLFEHDPWKTPFTFPMEMTIEELNARREQEPKPENPANVQTLTQETVDPEPAAKPKRSRK